VAIVDYTSPALCIPVSPFPPIGDAAYRQHTDGPSHRHMQHAQKLVKIIHVVPEISSRTDRHTDRHIILIMQSQYFATAPAGEVITNAGDWHLYVCIIMSTIINKQQMNYW